MQRLFSTFARGWPGAGLLAQRVIAAALLFYCAIAQISHPTHAQCTVLQMIAAAGGLLLLLGLWTPLAGMIVAISELAIVISHPAHPGMNVVLATFGATLAMIGPGACSIDARLFGRKEVRI